MLNGKRHYVLPDGNTIVPSVTTVLGSFEEAGLRAWKNKVGHDEAERISKEAAARGETFHLMVEKCLNNEPFERIIMETPSVDAYVAGKFMEAVPSLKKIDNIYIQEKCLWSKRLHTAGRVDCIAEWCGELSVIDFKTARKKKEERYIQNYFQQATCYGLMFEEITAIPVEQIVIIVASEPLQEPQIFVKNKSDYVLPLMEKLAEYNRALV